MHGCMDIAGCMNKWMEYSEGGREIDREKYRLIGRYVYGFRDG
jgi:hypothetical protein